MDSEESKPGHTVVAWHLFWTFLEIGAFTFGGGYAMIPIVKRRLVSHLGLLSDDDFMDALTVIQGAPGAVAINLAVFIGYRLAGVAGALASTTGAALPSLVVLMAVAAAFGRVADSSILKAVFAGARPAVLSLIVYSALNLSESAIRRPVDLVVAALALFVLVVFGIHPAIVIVVAGLVGLAMPGVERLAAQRRNRSGAV